ncbi:MAG: hypothetical protein ABIK44_02820 [candidate division WOR-3 bacterium]
MKRGTTMLLCLALCLGALASEDAAVVPQQIVNQKSAIGDWQSADAIPIPKLLSYQGKLTDTLGRPVPDGNYQLTFRLYTQETGGTPFWNETQTVRTKAGLFSVLLGAVNAIDSVPQAGSFYLGMAVGDGAELTPRLRLVSAAYAYLAARADTANFVLGGASDNAWVRGTPHSVLFTIRQLGIARGDARNDRYGAYRYSHINLGTECVTGAQGQDYGACVVTGGYLNTAGNTYATVCGSGENSATGYGATIGGETDNYATDSGAVVAGGCENRGSNWATTIGGGRSNTASGWAATVGGGMGCKANGICATVAGGSYDTSAAIYSFATNNHSVVPSSYSNPAAFNGTTATASSQLRCGTLAKTGGTFTIDHPLDPYGRILNHYFIEGPEMLNIYRGSVVLDATGRAEVQLPDYFAALNRNPHIQLTGVGRYEIYVVEDVKGNRFVIGGPANAKVYWFVTGERADVSAEAIRRMMPVEQPKTGELAGRRLDDDFLVGCMEQLVREGKASGIDFRIAAGRGRYERMKNPPRPEKEE